MEVQGYYDGYSGKKSKSLINFKKREKREKKLATTNDSNKPIFPSKTENLCLKVVIRKTHPSSKVIMKSQPDLPNSRV